MAALSEVGTLDVAANWLLQGLEKLNPSQLLIRCFFVENFTTSNFKIIYGHLPYLKQQELWLTGSFLHLLLPQSEFNYAQKGNVISD